MINGRSIFPTMMCPVLSKSEFSRNRVVTLLKNLLRDVALDCGEDAFGKERQILDSHFNCVVDGVADGGRDSHHREFADSFGAEWALRKRDLHWYGNDLRNLLGRWQFVIHERGIDDSSVFELQPFVQRVAQPHYNTTDDLSFDADRIQRSAYIVGRGNFFYLDNAGFFVQLDFHRLDRK